MKEDLKFVAENILRPEGKPTIHLGKDEMAQRLLAYFNQRSWKRAFIRNKRFNVALIDCDDFQDSAAYLNAVNGKNSAGYFSRRCEKAGYTFGTLDPNSSIDAIHEINTSSEERQGRKMDASYLEKIAQWPSDDKNIWYGIFSPDGKLVAYVWTVQAGQLVVLNRLLGHQDFLKDNVMYLLLTKLVGEMVDRKKGLYVMYDTFGRKKNGLVLFKKRIGFKPYTVNFKV